MGQTDQWTPKTGHKEPEEVAGSLAGPAQRPTNQDIKSNRRQWSTPAASSFRDFPPQGCIRCYLS